LLFIEIIVGKMDKRLREGILFGVKASSLICLQKNIFSCRQILKEKKSEK